MIPKQKGFSALHTLLLLMIISIVGGTGWYVWQAQKKADGVLNDANKSITPTVSRSKATVEESPKVPEEKTFKLYDGKATFDDDGSWKVATGGYWSNELHRCGRDTGPDPGCLDTIMLIPSDETFTNPDQFQVNINIFHNDDHTPIKDWVDQNIGDATGKTNESEPTVNELAAYRYEIPYGPNENRLVYAVAWEDYVILTRSSLFNGNHYSYKGTKDYLPYLSRIDKLVESINVK